MMETGTPLSTPTLTNNNVPHRPSSYSRTLFLLGCVPVRVALAIAVAQWSGLPVGLTASGAFVISIGFAVIYTLRLRRTGLETFGNPISPVVRSNLTDRTPASGGIICVHCMVFSISWQPCASVTTIAPPRPYSSVSTRPLGWLDRSFIITIQPLSHRSIVTECEREIGGTSLRIGWCHRIFFFCAGMLFFEE